MPRISRAAIDPASLVTRDAQSLGSGILVTADGAARRARDLIRARDLAGEDVALPAPASEEPAQGQSGPDPMPPGFEARTRLYAHDDGYALYGDLVDDAFQLALTSTAQPIGANTTIWLDTDLDRTSGHLIWGWAGGVEYNVNIGADGVARLYTGGAGEVWVADLVQNRAADGSALIVEVPRSLLDGAPARLRVLADINDGVFLPGDYASADLQVGESASAGGKILDGGLGDWSAAMRLDGPETGAEGFALYGDAQDGAFTFAIASDGVAIGANTTIWLDADFDGSTGYQVWGWAVGAEYNINIGGDGVARLFSGAAGETFIAEIAQGRSADGKVLELAVDAALLGGATGARVFADVNDAVFIPNSYASANFIIGEQPATPVPEPMRVGAMTLDGDLSDWDAGSLLYESGVYQLRGDLVTDDQGAGHYVLAIAAADGSAIGTNTTLWLNTDRDTGTGYQIWGWAGGAEYNINIGADGQARLYSGAAGQNFVADIDHAFSADRSVVKIAVSQAVLDGSPAINLLVDVNDTVFLPGDYLNTALQIGEIAPPVAGGDGSPEMRVAIVYSETTAAHFYDLTAYGQLFMAAQNQAMQAGIPYDLLGEADLLDPANLANYDAIVFPGFSHVQSGQVATIAASLATAMQDYGLGLIAAGNFLTNDETGAALPGDSYARMKSLLGVTLDGYGATEGIRLEAGNAAHQILDGYGAGQVVGDYANNSYLNFTDITGAGEVLFRQLVGEGGAQTALDAVIATQTIGRNVHFATDAILGNNNILGAAIDWVVQDDAPDVSLLMTRGSSLFYGRIDMDQAQELWDIAHQDPGLYDAFVPIMAEWAEKYGFVGSYYIDIGADPDEYQLTDWAISAPYYQALIDLGGEIGSHSFTHPHDTNTLLPDTPEILALIAQVDPRNPDAVDPWALSPAEQALLLSSYRFQFETSKLIIEHRLGIEVTGAAVPGMPEQVHATREMMQFYDYLSGGYSGAGAGYPGAFGYLTPQDGGHVYLAPNMAFDFTLMEWLGMTPAEAEARWLDEYAQLTAGATVPIIAFPFHDYGPTSWDLGDTGPVYSLQMFESLIAQAAADGTEFVTGADLAARIASFAASSLSVTQSGDLIAATVISDNAGHFVLDLGAEGSIASVAGWYAWDGSSVFVDRDGGSFAISLGPQADDVTRIATLPTQAELISVSGDGSNLDFSIAGAGVVGLSLRSQGTDAVVISGADEGRLSAAGRVELGFADQGANSASVSYRASGQTVSGTQGNDILISGSGDDILAGGEGADSFIFMPGMGSDTILDFQSGVDVLALMSFGFLDTAAVHDAFRQVADGLELLLGGHDRLLLADLDFDSFMVSDIVVDEFIFV